MDTFVRDNEVLSGWEERRRLDFLRFSLSPIRRRALESGDETLEIEMSCVCCVMDTFVWEKDIWVLTVEWLRGETSVRFLSFWIYALELFFRRGRLESAEETRKREMSYVCVVWWIHLWEIVLSGWEERRRLDFLSFSFLPLNDEKFKTRRLKIESPSRRWARRLHVTIWFPTVLNRISQVLSKMYTVDRI